MINSACLSRITIYPVKALDGISLQKAWIGPGGNLLHDRQYAIKDANNKYVNGKKNAMVHLLRTKFELDTETIFFKHQLETGWHRYHLQQDKKNIDDYLSDFFNEPVNLYKNNEGKFLDKPVKSSMTLVSTASLEAVNGWFNNLEIEQTRKRFRATIEINNVPAFWEDQLFLNDTAAIEFKVGNVTLWGRGPRARCVVPTRDTNTGETITGFQKQFVQQRLASLPQWSTLQNYNHSYYLCVDCQVPDSEIGKYINVGDSITILGKKELPQEMDN